ncbi:MAG: protein-disulfide reductase DsbD [Burkholderiales bacterium]|jgi:thiol:disulfide interchange protein DsbD|nr:protein-disulfide reductase DsbD [Polynucleobacter sp.]MCX7244523.1 protein-disulfide reductase DsbD [Burkholderiales bacterium]
MQLNKTLFTVLLTLSLLLSSAFAAPDFLPPEKAFQVQATWLENGRQVEIEYKPVKGYYIYQQSLQFHVLENGQPSHRFQPTLPTGENKFDATFNKNLIIYKAPFQVQINLNQAISGTEKAVIDVANSAKGLRLQIELQGCADGGICYPPMTLNFNLAAPGVKVKPMPDDAAMAPFPPEKLNLIGLLGQRDDINAVNQFLEQATTPYLFLAFFILGIALAFTPCVLPMLPILSSIIFNSGTNQAIKKRRAAVLASAYILGMACLYSLAGMLMAALGSGAQVALQNPYVLLAFGLVLLTLAGSLFGFYHLRLPHAWHQSIDQFAGRQKGGSIVGAFILGGLSTLIASPCITAPLAGVLAFIAQTGSVALGGGLLFIMALGMGLPLLFIALEVRVLIPTTGNWMVWLQRTLGVLLVALSIWIVWPAFFSGPNAFFTSKSQIQSAPGAQRIIAPNLSFTVIRSTAELNQVLAKAKLDQRPVLLDFYADWCISCKEMEHLTFSNSAVTQALGKFNLVQADVTLNTPESQALLKQFNLFGPPAILFFDAEGREQKTRRVIGFMSAQHFLDYLKLQQ